MSLSINIICLQLKSSLFNLNNKKMKEFMFLIHNEVDHLSHLSADEKQQFLKACMDYINKLLKEGKLKAAQPLVKEGKILSGSKAAWKDGPFNETKEVIVGYYHILANNIDEAIEIAKGNPEFEYTSTARIEIRPIKMVEQTTEFVYPDKH
jgi:hypothetical protein